MSKQSFRARAKKLFKQVHTEVPYVTNSIIKKYYPWFRVSISEDWANLVDILSTSGLENDKEVINTQYKITEKAEFPLTTIYYYSFTSKRSEWAGKIGANVSGTYNVYLSKSGGLSVICANYESAIKTLVNRREKELQASKSLFAS